MKRLVKNKIFIWPIVIGVSFSFLFQNFASAGIGRSYLAPSTSARDPEILDEFRRASPAQGRKPDWIKVKVVDTEPQGEGEIRFQGDNIGHFTVVQRAAYNGKMYWAKFMGGTGEIVHVITPQAEILFYLNKLGIKDIPNATHFLEDNNGRRIILFSDFSPGEPLLKKIERTRGNIPEGEAIDIIIKVSRIVKKVHDAGVYHWDLSPGNIWLTEAGDVILIDFDLAFRTREEFIERKLYIGMTLPYTSQKRDECRSSEGNIEASFFPPVTSEVYSLGMVLMHMLLGGSSRSKDVKPERYANGQLRILQGNPIISAELKTVLDKAISNGNSDYRTVEEFIQALEVCRNKLLHGSPVGIAIGENQIVPLDKGLLPLSDVVEWAAVVIGDGMRRSDKYNLIINALTISNIDFFIVKDPGLEESLKNRDVVLQVIDGKIRIIMTQNHARYLAGLDRDSAARLLLCSITREFAEYKGLSHTEAELIEPYIVSNTGYSVLYRSIKGRYEIQRALSSKDYTRLIQLLLPHTTAGDFYEGLGMYILEELIRIGIIYDVISPKEEDPEFIRYLVRLVEKKIGEPTAIKDLRLLINLYTLDMLTRYKDSNKVVIDYPSIKDVLDKPEENGDVIARLKGFLAKICVEGKTKIILLDPTGQNDGTEMGNKFEIQFSDLLKAGNFVVSTIGNKGVSAEEFVNDILSDLMGSIIIANKDAESLYYKCCIIGFTLVTHILDKSSSFKLRLTESELERLQTLIPDITYKREEGYFVVELNRFIDKASNYEELRRFSDEILSAA